MIIGCSFDKLAHLPGCRTEATWLCQTVGVDSRVSDDRFFAQDIWRLRYRHILSNITLRLAIRAAGERMRISNQNDYAVSSSDLQLRMTGVNNSLRCEIKLSDDFGMTIELGSITRRSIEIVSGSSTLFTTNVNPARYLSVGIHYHFSTALTTEME